MRLPILFIAALTALPGFAQYDLATTRDGSTLYFSALGPGKTGFPIYRWTKDTGVTLFGDRPDLTQASVYGERLYGTELTDEGTVIFHAEAGCATSGGPNGNTCPLGQTEIMTPGVPPFSIDNFLFISPNGRYGLFAPFHSGAIWADWLTGQQVEIDFHNQGIPDVNPPYVVNQHVIANNGSFVVTAPGGVGVRIWSPNGEIVVNPGGVASLSADGSTLALLVSDRSTGTFPVRLYDAASGQLISSIPCIENGPNTFSAFSMSEDGKTIAYSPCNGSQQAIVADSTGANARQITVVPEGVRSVLLSGDAHYLYVVTGDLDFPLPSRLQRYDLTIGTVDDIQTFDH
ncbi:MAG TPA: hypothetical protein VGN17_21855 [Bryobacteraceae bacterium]|jgi:sugar lactone lactonase YvrE